MVGAMQDTGLGRKTTIFACGAALFADGYSNAVSGPVNTILRRLYPEQFADRNASQLFSSMAFAGTIVGIVTFGYLSDRVGRKPGMIFASLWISLWSVMAGLAYGAGGSIYGLISALIAYRFLIGIGIGAEYPAGSVACSENTEDPGINKKIQHRLFVLSTNSMIDLGFVLAPFIAYLNLQIFTDNQLEWVWRLSLGLGAIFPLVVLFFRLKMQEPEHYKKSSMKDIAFFRLPWKLIFRKYGARLAAVSLAWFVYDWVVYPSNAYGGVIVARALPDGGTLSQQLGWSTLLNTFYLPGSIIGAFCVDRLGPRNQLVLGLLLQAIVGFILSGAYEKIKQSVAGFTIIYGIYLSLGEFGPGNSLGLLASKATGPTASRGVFYAISASIGKLGAFIATYVFTPITDSLGGEGTYAGDTGPVFIGSGLAFVAAIVVWFFVPNFHEDFMLQEDVRFRHYLEEAGFDTSQLGVKALLEADSLEEKKVEHSATVTPVLEDESHLNGNGKLGNGKLNGNEKGL